MRGGARNSPLHTWLVSVQQREGIKWPLLVRLWIQEGGEEERERETRREETIKEKSIS